MEQKQTYTIMIQGYIGVGPNRDPHLRKMTTTCTKEELDNIANVWLMEYNAKYDFVCCIANDGDYVDNSHWEYMYQDCM